MLLFSIASFFEASFWGVMGAFTPLYLAHLGVPAAQLPAWTGATVAISSAVGPPFLPFWGALANFGQFPRPYSERPAR